MNAFICIRIKIFSPAYVQKLQGFTEGCRVGNSAFNTTPMIWPPKGR